MFRNALPFVLMILTLLIARQVGPPKSVATTSIENPSGTSGCINEV